MNEPLVIQLSRQWHRWVAKSGQYSIKVRGPFCSSGSQRFWVIIARGTHPFPSRTRQLSPSAPMVLHAQVCGRVGSCPVMSKAPAERLGLLLFLGGLRPMVATNWGHGNGQTCSAGLRRTLAETRGFFLNGRKCRRSPQKTRGPSLQKPPAFTRVGACPGERTRRSGRSRPTAPVLRRF